MPMKLGRSWLTCLSPRFIALGLASPRFITLGLVTVGLVVLPGCPSAPPTLPPPSLCADPASDDASNAGAATSEIDRARAYIENDAFDRALPHLDRAILAMPSSAEAHYYRGLVHERGGKRANAERDYEHAIELDPKLTEPRINLGMLYLDEPARPARAVEVLAPAAELEPNAADVHRNLALAYRMLKKVDESEQSYRKALAIADDPAVRFDLADLLFEAQRPAKMVTELRLLLAKLDADKDRLVVVAHRLAKAGAFDACVGAFTKLAALDAKEPGFLLHRGLCQHELKNEPAAREDFTKATQLEPKLQAAHYYLGVSYAESGEPAKAAEALERAVKLGADTPVGQKAKERYDGLLRESRNESGKKKDKKKDKKKGQ